MTRTDRARRVSTDLRGFGALALASLLVGLGINQVRRQPLPLVYHARQERLRAAVGRLTAGESMTVSPVSVARAREIGIEEFQTLISHRAMVIDARAPFFYAQGHVPGAINLPREEFEAAYPRLADRLSARKAEAAAVYCSGSDCEDARLVTDALMRLGFRQLLIYKEGWDEWSQSGLPQEK